MAILEWWNSLEFAAQIFYCIAIPSTLILLIQTVLLFLGIGEDGDGDAIFDGISGAGSADDIPDVPDVDEGVFDAHPVSDTHDLSGLDGLRIFTVRGVIAFLVVFGWVGGVMAGADVALWITVPVATVCGLTMMITLAYLFRSIMRLRSDGNADNRNAIGTSGKVHLTIPPERTGEGKVHLMLQGALVERDAVTDEKEAIPTGSEIVVQMVSGQTTLVVRRK